MKRRLYAVHYQPSGDIEAVFDTLDETKAYIVNRYPELGEHFCRVYAWEIYTLGREIRTQKIGYVDFEG